MKHTFIFCFILLSALAAVFPVAALSQDSINPYTIQQSGTIELHGKLNVYYNPFAPPGSMDTRLNLCNESDQLRDSNAIGNLYRDYLPLVYDTAVDSFVLLRDWHPHGTVLGQFAVWQRLFQSKNGDIIAGGNSGDSVVISKNEDVDFRAHGRIILKNGFRVKGGCFFHAYTDPKWDTTVFSDEFDDTAKFHNQWHVNNGWGDYYTQGADCSADTNVRLITDTDAYDDHALDIMIREDTVDTCLCLALGGYDTDRCESILATPLDTQKFIFSTALLRSCPFPDSQHVTRPFATAYAHAPYGKYEMREKIPHTQFHTNNWGGGYGMEWDMNETDNGYMNILNPNFNHQFQYGPCKGVFRTVGGTTVFISSEPEWCSSNKPEAIVINNIPYPVQVYSSHTMDTVFDPPNYYQPPWPASLTSSTDSITFSYTVLGNCSSDTVHWTVDTIGGERRVFSAWYHIDSHGDTLRFSKWNQPSAITLTIDRAGDKKTFPCHWEYTLNRPIDQGLLFLDSVANDRDSVHTMASTDFHNNTESFAFDRRVLYSTHQDYPVPVLPFDGNDSAAGYEYHTFTMEILPHEIRYLYDSMVLRRFPDRLVPRSSPYYDWISTFPRCLFNIRPAEIDMDNNGTDVFGTIDSVSWNDTADNFVFYKSVNYQERHYFETHTTNPGFWPVDGQPAAHFLIDYIKVFDIPKNVYVPDYPH